MIIFVSAAILYYHVSVPSFQVEPYVNSCN